MALVYRNPRICSVKIFYFRSTGSGEIEITDEQEQREMWQNVGTFGFKRAVSQHLEDGKMFDYDIPFNPGWPRTHSQHQRSIAEERQVERQIKNACDAGFEGIFVALHTSSDRTIDYLNSMRAKVPFRIVIETTPHHMLLNWDDYGYFGKKHGNGNLVKMNPPLRPKYMQERVLERVLEGKTDIIGTDHAPHPIERKSGEKPASGIQGIPIWPFLIKRLRGLGMREPELKRITFDTGNEIYFEGKLKPRCVRGVEYNPELWAKYGFNPFERVDGTK